MSGPACGVAVGIATEDERTKIMFSIASGGTGSIAMINVSAAILLFDQLGELLYAIGAIKDDEDGEEPISTEEQVH